MLRITLDKELLIAKELLMSMKPMTESCYNVGPLSMH